MTQCLNALHARFFCWMNQKTIADIAIAIRRFFLLMMAALAGHIQWHIQLTGVANLCVG